MCLVFVATHRLSLVVLRRPHIAVAPRAWALGMQALVVLTHKLSCLHSMWDLPGQGIEPVSSALPGRFLTTGPPRKS